MENFLQPIRLKQLVVIFALMEGKTKQTKRPGIGVLSISSKHLNFLDLELKENSRKIKLLEIGLEDRRSVHPNLCPKNHKTFLLSISAVFVMQFLLEFTWFLELNWQVNRINSRSRQVTYNNNTNQEGHSLIPLPLKSLHTFLNSFYPITKCDYVFEWNGTGQKPIKVWRFRWESFWIHKIATNLPYLPHRRVKWFFFARMRASLFWFWIRSNTWIFMTFAVQLRTLTNAVNPSFHQSYHFPNTRHSSLTHESFSHKSSIHLL